MTREEAIKAMTKYMPKDNDSVSLVLREAMNMGIKALEQEPCEDFVVGVDFTGRFVKASEAFREPCNDAISRQAVIEHYNSGEILQCNHVSRNNLLNYIEGLPSIQPKPKTECSCEQIKWERDIAIEQLHELGYELGQKIEPCEDCISRQATVERLCKVAEFMNEKRNGLGSPYVMAALFIQDNKDEFPSVTPKPKTDEPMQVDLEGDGYADGELVYDYGKCPKCGWEFEYGDKDWEEPYCCHCGQRLKWFESEEQE